MESKMFQTLEGFSQLANCEEKKAKRKVAKTAEDREGERDRFLAAPNCSGSLTKKRRNRKKENKEVSLAEAQRTQRV